MAEKNSHEEPLADEASGAPPFPGQKDVDLGDEAAYNPTLFCTLIPDDVCEDLGVSCCSDSVDGALGAAVSTEYLWKERGVLKVYFEEPDNPKKWGWQYEGKDIDPDMIIDWANVWNPDDDEKIPTFVQTGQADKGDIRVQFTDSRKKGCWSVLGMLASRVDTKKPTMVLNLGSHYHNEDKRSLVIHEFGHALGLEHEHQRPDFWAGVEKHIDLKRMKDDPRVRDPIYKVGVASFGAGWFEDRESFLSTIRKVFGISRDPGTVMTKYDCKSIMHYGFNTDWLKKNTKHNLHNIRDLLKDRDLPEEEKEFLRGIHERHVGLAKDPSPLDLEALKMAYHGKIDALRGLRSP